MNKICLIGESGFVGSNLKNMYKFDDFYNSKNIQNIEGKEYKTIFCAAPSAIKWLANKDPINDLNSITILINMLKTVKTDKFILFSTVDIYGNNLLGDENKIIDIKNNHAYGRNRFLLEVYVSQLFDTLTLRLPALFGNFLKKNIIFDLINKNMLDAISPNTQFQWLYLEKINFFINFGLKNNISILNCVTEPLFTYEIIDTFFPQYKNICKNTQNFSYNITTTYTKNNYFFNKNEILNDLGIFLKK